MYSLPRNYTEPGTRKKREVGKHLAQRRVEGVGGWRGLAGGRGWRGLAEICDRENVTEIKSQSNFI